MVGEDFFPSVDAGLMRLHVRAPTGTRIERTELLVDNVERAIRNVIPAQELEGISDNIGVPISFDLAYYQTDSMPDPGTLLFYGHPTMPTRGVGHVHLTSPANSNLTAEMADVDGTHHGGA